MHTTVRWHPRDRGAKVFEVVDDAGRVIVRTHAVVGGSPTTAQAEANMMRLAGILAGECSLADTGWTVQRTPAGFFVRGKAKPVTSPRGPILAHRHPGDFPGDDATAEECLGYADLLDPRT